MFINSLLFVETFLSRHFFQAAQRLGLTSVQNDEGGPGGRPGGWWWRQVCGLRPGGRDTFPHNRFLTAFPLSKVGKIFGPFLQKVNASHISTPEFSRRWKLSWNIPLRPSVKDHLTVPQAMEMCIGNAFGSCKTTLLFNSSIVGHTQEIWIFGGISCILIKWKVSKFLFLGHSYSI